MIPTAANPPFPPAPMEAIRVPTIAAAAFDSTISSCYRDQDELFVKALAVYDPDSGTQWDNVAFMVAMRDVEEVKRYYESLLQQVNRHCKLLLEDVKRHYKLLLQNVITMEEGQVASPSYNTSVQPVLQGAGDQWDHLVGQSRAITPNGTNWCVNGGIEGPRNQQDSSLTVIPNRQKLASNGGLERAGHQWNSSIEQSPGVTPNAANKGVISELQGASYHWDSVGQAPVATSNGTKWGINRAFEARHKWDSSTSQFFRFTRSEASRGLDGGDQWDSLARQSTPGIANDANRGVNSGLPVALDQWDNSPRVNSNEPNLGASGGFEGAGHHLDSSAQQAYAVTSSGAKRGLDGTVVQFNDGFVGTGHHLDSSARQSSGVIDIPTGAKRGLDDGFATGEQWDNSSRVTPNEPNLEINRGFQRAGQEWDCLARQSPRVTPSEPHGGLDCGFETQIHWDNSAGNSSPLIPNSGKSGDGVGDLWNSSASSAGQSPLVTANGANLGINGRFQGGNEGGSLTGQSPPITPNRVNRDVNDGFGRKYSNSKVWSKGEYWTKEEHKLFLLGLAKFGKGDWRSISQYYVLSRTSSQVASHAQKYFIRLNSEKKNRKRLSIHDITSVNEGDGHAVLGNLGPLTGRSSSTMPTTSQPTLQANPDPKS